MRRVAAAVLSTLALGAALAASPQPTSAAPAPAPLTGKLVSWMGTHPPVVGATVRLRELGPGSTPGTVVDTDVTDAYGRFALSAGSSDQEEFFVQVLPGRYQGGYVGGVPLAVQPHYNDAGTWSRDYALGRVFALPAFIRGVVVDSATQAPVKGVRVVVRTQETGTIHGSDVTDAAGVFDVGGLTCEDECALRLNGSAVSYETGFRACDATVVPTWGEACASPIGRIGRVLLDHL